jgi:hypothetical protein
MAEINHSNREHALLSASSAHRWLACPPSAVAAELYEDTGSEFAAEGTLAHEVAEITARRRIPQLYPDIDTMELPESHTPEMVEHAEGYADYLQELITDPDAVVLLEQRVDFSAWVLDGFGTCDALILQGDTLTVVDYKYGQGVAVSAQDNPQMRLYALGALNDYGIAYDVQRVEMHIYQPRINNISTDTLSVDALTEWAEKVVKPTAAKAAKGKGTYKAGAHCKFCPHAGKCRALAKTCTEYVETHGMRVAVPTLAPHEVAEALQLEPLVRLWLDRVKAQALNTLMGGGEVPGFKLVEGKLGNRKWSDELQVAQALNEAGYSEADYTTVSILSPAGMDKALGKKRAAELLEQYISRTPGAPVLAPESDKRPRYNPADEFDSLED